MRIQRLIAGLLVVGAAVGCTAVQPGGNNSNSANMAGTVTEVAVDPVLGLTATLVATSTLTATSPLSATPPITATPPVTATQPVTATAVPTATQSPTGTVTPTATQTISGTPTVSATATLTVTSIATGTPPISPTELPTTPVETPTGTPGTPLPTETPVPSPTIPATPTAPPTATYTPGPPPTPTPLPSTVFVRNHRSYLEGSSLFVVGEAVNGGPASVFNLRVIATFYDAGGRLIGAQETIAFLPQTQPTQANPFQVVLANAPGGIQRYDLALAWDEISIAEFDRVTVAREEVRESTGVEIVGDLRNDHRDEIRSLMVVATFYDQAGAVLDVLPGSVEAATLAPGAMTTFSVTSSRPLDYATYLVQTQGMIFR